MAYLLIIGFRSSKKRRVTLNQIFALPFFLALWSFFGLYERWGGEWEFLGYLIIALIGGICIGWRMIKNWIVYVDREHKTISLPGTWSTMILALLIFAVRYSFGFYYATHITVSTKAFIMDLMASGLITGILIGRAIHLWRKYESS